MGSVFLRGDSWVMEYRERNGRIKRESAGKRGVITKTQAKAILNKREQSKEYYKGCIKEKGYDIEKLKNANKKSEGVS